MTILERLKKRNQTLSKALEGESPKRCPDCENGEIEVRDDAREFDINERWKKVKCETCNGEGEI